MAQVGADRASGADAAAVREQLERLAEALEALAKAEGAEAMKSAERMARRAAEQATAVLDDLAGTAQTVAAAADKGRGHVEDAVRQNPWAALSLAAAAGFLLAMVIRR
ncbi:MAG: glycine zipper domain-containing protein [Pseudomonadota bacterium]